MIFRSSLIQVFYSLFPVFLASFFLSSCIFLLLSLNSPSPLIPPSYPSSLLFRLHTFSYPLSHPPSLLLSLVSSFTPSPSLFFSASHIPSLPSYFISSLPFTPSRPHPPVLSPSSSLPLALILPPSCPLYSSGAPHHSPFSRGLVPVHDSHHYFRKMCHRCEKSRVKRSEQDKVRF